MATLKDIKLRMISIESTQQITKAMKMVAASKMRRAEENIVRARPYSEKLRRVISNLSDGLDSSAHPLLQKRDGGKAIVLLITTDRGLCGGLNVNLCKKLERFTPDAAHPFEFAELITFGKKGREFFRTRKMTVTQSFRDLKEKEMVATLQQQMQSLIQQYVAGEFNHLFLAFNQFRNVVSQIPTISQVLPIIPPKIDAAQPEEKTEFIFEPTSHDILNTILPKYIENQAFTALLDNIASEHAARMTAMDAATNNASDMLSSLQIKYNRARQAEITSELIEIISGAEAI